MEDLRSTVENKSIQNNGSTDKAAQTCLTSSNFIHQSLQDRLEKLLKQVAPLRDETSEGIHDMRVASRRMRTALNAFKPWLDAGLHEDFCRRIESITNLLGRPRELDVMDGMLAKYKLQLKGPWLDAANHAHAAIQKSRAKAAPQCKEALGIVESTHFQQTFTALLDSCTEMNDCLLLEPPKRLQKRLNRLQKKYTLWLNSENEPHLHEVRIAAKKLRYACELYAPLYGEDMRQFIKTLKHIQETLGAWNDWRVLRNEVESVAQTASYRAVQGFPLLIEQLDVQAKRHLHRFEHQVKEFQNIRNQGRKLFKVPVAPCCQWKESN